MNRARPLVKLEGVVLFFNDPTQPLDILDALVAHTVMQHAIYAVEDFLDLEAV